MNEIHVKGIKSHSYHGCMKEEAKIGADYIVDIVVKTDFIDAAKTDDLSKTVDYVLINRIVEEEMAIRSDLIETVGYRIVQRLIADVSLIDHATATIKKINPPINGNVDYVSIVVSHGRG